MYHNSIKQNPSFILSLTPIKLMYLVCTTNDTLPISYYDVTNVRYSVNFKQIPQALLASMYRIVII